MGGEEAGPGSSRRSISKDAPPGRRLAGDLELRDGRDGTVVADENARFGSEPTEWRATGSRTIAGFTSDISYNAGDTVGFRIRHKSRYRVTVYRLGWYQGLGARLVGVVDRSEVVPRRQPKGITDAATGLLDCGNWAISATWTIPSDAVSGIYYAKLEILDRSGQSNYIPFVVRNDGRRADVVYQTTDTTWQAYNDYGGNSMYCGTTVDRAYKVSYNRPFNPYGLDTSLWDAGYPMLRFLERNGYDVTYLSGVDVDRRGAELGRHRVFLSPDHDEYWSKDQRANVEAARDAGVHLAFCSGNEVFWKVRWESSVDGTGTPHRTMVCYKETLENAKIDPRPEWTGTWRDPRFSPPTDGGRPENSLTGVLFRGQNGNPARAELAIQVPFAHAGQRLWRNTPVAALRPGETTILSPGTLGYEWDCDEDNGERPAGLIRLSETTVIAPMKLLDHGGTYGPASTTHRVTMYRAASGALVFAAGSIRWAWGLDETHPIAAPTDGSVQQAMVNLLADMGVQPATLLAGLVPASGPTDSTAPVSAVTWPAPGAAVTVGAPVSITGTAVDAAGRVAAVEVSVDGGATWHPAAGTGTWRYVFVPDRPGPIAVRSRAVDDSVNLETPGPGHTLQARARPYPVSIWTDNTVPAMSASNDEAAVEVGLKVRFEVPGFVTGLRYYRGAGSAGARTGRLWSAAGTVLGTCTFDGRTVDGWQQVAFSSPVAVGAGATYVASAYFPHGRYAADSAYFERSRGSYPVRALGDGEDGPNGVYRYGRGGRLPTDTFGATNYWVDVVFHGSESVPGVPPAGHHRGPAPDADVRTSNSEVVELRDPARSDGG